MIEQVIKWRSVKEDGLPEKSGYYVCYNTVGFISVVQYSASHKLFNCADYETREKAEKTAIKVDYWTDKIGLEGANENN